MATWIELRCSKLSVKPAAGGKANRCLSSSNDGPMGLAADSQQSVLALLKKLGAHARKQGWVKTRDGWVCPACKDPE